MDIRTSNKIIREFNSRRKDNLANLRDTNRFKVVSQVAKNTANTPVLKSLWTRIKSFLIGVKNNEL